MNGTRTCTVEGCDRPHKARGLCGSHYSQWRNKASVEQQLWPTRSERFWAKVDRSGGPHACWPWTGSTVPEGYGVFYNGTRLVRAHRYSFMSESGSPATGDVDHLCHNLDESCRGGHSCPHRLCVNPSHLEDVDHKTNVRRGRAGSFQQKGRRKTECIHGHAYDDANRYTDRNGHQRCRECARERSRRTRKETA